MRPPSAEPPTHIGPGKELPVKLPPLPPPQAAAVRPSFMGPWGWQGSSPTSSQSLSPPWESSVPYKSQPPALKEFLSRGQLVWNAQCPL